MAMVRKQLYIASDQERRLKRLAARLGVTEAELVREGLEQVLRRRGGQLATPVGDTAAALEDFFIEADTWAKGIAALPKAARRWRREELYTEREDRSPS